MFGLLLFIIVCAFIWYQSHAKLNRVHEEIATLKKELEDLKQTINSGGDIPVKSEQPLTKECELDADDTKHIVVEEAEEPESEALLAEQPVAEKEPELSGNEWESVVLYNDANKTPWFKGIHFNSSSLLWVGAFILALGGIFLAKYTIESGLISPVARVLLGSLFGISLVVAGEYLIRFPQKYNLQSREVCAALVSAGVVTCYAMSLVSSHYYSFLQPPWSVAVLVAISLSAALLALRFGPIVAAIGMIGAYAVPALFGWTDNDVIQLLVYVVLVSLSAIYVANKVRSQWLWWMSFAGHFVWYLTAVLVLPFFGKPDIWLMLVWSCISLYMYVFSDVIGWRLERGNQQPLSIKTLLMFRKEQVGLVCSIFPIWAYYVLFGYQDSLLICTLVIVAILLSAPLKHSAFDTWPFLGLLLSLLTLILQAPSANYLDDYFVFAGMHLYTQVTALAFFIYAAFMQRLLPQRHVYSLLFVCAPAALFGLGYILSPVAANHLMYSLWATELAIIACVGFYLTKHSSNSLVKLSGWLLINFNLALMFTMLLDSATLTLALIAQVAGVGYWARKFGYMTPHWLIKVALTLIVLRLTLAPWIPPYLHETLFGIHWTIVIYPIAYLSFSLSQKWFNQLPLNSWFMGIKLHLIALFITTETSYFLVGHYPTFIFMSFKECILLALNWLVLGSVYYYRSELGSRSFSRIFQIAAAVMLCGSGFMYLQLLSGYNPFLLNQEVGSSLFLNWLIPLWLIPSLILLAMIKLKLKLVVGRVRIAVLAVSGIFIVLFINGMVRLPFHTGSIGLQLMTSPAELYTYSLVWLIVSTGFIVWSQKNSSALCHRIGFAILAIVTAKAFVVDMSQLEGIYRALSFMGLGLCLIGVGWLFQRLKKSSDVSSIGS